MKKSTTHQFSIHTASPNTQKHIREQHTPRNPQNLHPSHHPPQPLLHLIHFTQPLRHLPTGPDHRRVVQGIVLAAQAALDDAAGGQRVEAPGEVDEGDEGQERADGAPGGRVWWDGAVVVVVRDGGGGVDWGSAAAPVVVAVVDHVGGAGGWGAAWGCGG